MICPHRDTSIKWGQGVNIGMFSRLACINEISLGNTVLTGPNVFISDHNHAYEDVEKPISAQGNIGNNNKVIIDAKEHEWKKNDFVRNMFATWWRAFRSSSNFRRTFLLAFYTAMILLRTVLNREIWFDPLGKLFGGWGLYEDGQFTTESIENFMLFVPFSILLLWTFQKELLDESENIRFGKTVWEATKVVAVFSFLIEFTQLLFHLGTFQISDLVYNTLGGAVGGVIYYLGYCRKRKNKIRNRGQLSEH